MNGGGACRPVGGIGCVCRVALVGAQGAIGGADCGDVGFHLKHPHINACGFRGFGKNRTLYIIRRQGPLIDKMGLIVCVIVSSIKFHDRLLPGVHGVVAMSSSVRDSFMMSNLVGIEINPNELGAHVNAKR